MDFLEIPIVEGTLGVLILSTICTAFGFLVKGWLENHGKIRVAEINADVSLNGQAIQVMTTAMEVLKDENTDLKITIAQMENHMDCIIELLISMMKATSQQEADKLVLKLEQFLKSIGRWPY